LSDLRVNSISDAAGTGPVTLTKQSAAKAWAKLDYAAAISDSFNISSAVDTSTALKALNFTVSMASENYAAYVMQYAVTAGALNTNTAVQGLSTTGFSAYHGGETVFDGVVTAIHGDLA
jgi:hypothetical protein